MQSQTLDPALVFMLKTICVLLVVVMLGVAAAEKALNRLTEQEDFVHVVNIRTTPAGIYGFYLFGEGWQISGLVPVGNISTDGSKIAVTVGKRHWECDTVVKTDKNRILSFLEDLRVKWNRF